MHSPSFAPLSTTSLLPCIPVPLPLQPSLAASDFEEMDRIKLIGTFAGNTIKEFHDRRSLYFLCIMDLELDARFPNSDDGMD